MIGNTNPSKSRNCFRAKCGVCDQHQHAGAVGEERGLPCSVSNITYKYMCQAAPARMENNGDNDTSAQNGGGQDTQNGRVAK